MSHHHKRKPVQGDLFIPHQAEPHKPEPGKTEPTRTIEPEVTLKTVPPHVVKEIFSTAVWPYIHNGSSTKELAFVWLAALIPGFAIYIYSGTAHLATALCAVAGSVLAKIVWQKMSFVENDRPFVHAVYNGLLASLLIPPDIPLWVTLSGMILAVSLTNAALYKLHARLINPALLTGAVLSLIYPASFQAMPAIGMPLLLALAVGGVFLATSKLITLFPSLILFLTQMIARWLNSSATTAVTALTVTAMLFLVPDYDNSPLFARTKLLQAMIIAVLMLALGSWTPLAAPLLIAMLIASLLTPVLDRIHAK